MPRYTMLFAEDVSCYGSLDFEADNDEAAVEVATQRAVDGDVDTSPAWDTGADNKRIVSIGRVRDGAPDEIGNTDCELIAEDISLEPDPRTPVELAATDLLAALKRLAYQHYGDGQFPEYVEAAIAKAEGR